MTLINLFWGVTVSNKHICLRNHQYTLYRMPILLFLWVIHTSTLFCAQKVVKVRTRMSNEGIQPYKSTGLSSVDDNLSPTKWKKMEDLTTINKQKPRLYIMDTLANISIISSKKDLGMDAYLQPAFTDIQLGKAWSLRLGMIMVTVHHILPVSDQFVYNMMDNYACHVIVHVNPPDATLANCHIVISPLAVVSDIRCNSLLSFQQ